MKTLRLLAAVSLLAIPALARAQCSPLSGCTRMAPAAKWTPDSTLFSISADSSNKYLSRALIMRYLRVFLDYGVHDSLATNGLRLAAGKRFTYSGNDTIVGSPAYLATDTLFGAPVWNAGQTIPTITTNGASPFFKHIASASGTYGTSQYGRWLRSDGTTNRAQLGFTGDNSQTFHMETAETGDTILIRPGAFGSGTTMTTTGGVQSLGTTTNDTAVTGNIGEYLHHETAINTTLNLSTGSYTAVDSVTLSAGDWWCSGVAIFRDTSATTTQLRANVDSVRAATAVIYRLATLPLAFSAAIDTIALPVAPFRISLSGTQKMYLNAMAMFSTNKVYAAGGLNCRRAR